MKEALSILALSAISACSTGSLECIDERVGSPGLECSYETDDGFDYFAEVKDFPLTAENDSLVCLNIGPSQLTGGQYFFDSKTMEFYAKGGISGFKQIPYAALKSTGPNAGSVNIAPVTDDLSARLANAEEILLPVEKIVIRGPEFEHIEGSGTISYFWDASHCN